MATKTLKTLVLKTATVGGVKLLTPADRIGLGFVVVAAHPADVLSAGQFPLPLTPARNSGPGDRQAPAAMQSMQATATAEPPAGPAGRVRVPGSSAVRARWSSTACPLTGWRATTKRAGRTGSHPRAGLPVRLDRDCQSLDRRADRTAASTPRYPLSGYRGAWEVVPPSAAGT